MKRMTESRLRKIAKALGWRDQLWELASGDKTVAFHADTRPVWIDRDTGTKPEVLADEIAAGWAKAKFGVNVELVGHNYELSFAGSVDREFTARSPRLSTAVLVAACDWADAGCPGGKVKT